MGVEIFSFTHFSLYCKHVLRKHFPEGYKHLKTRVDKKQQDGVTVNVLVLIADEKEACLPETLEEWYEKYQKTMVIRDITEDMVVQCVQVADAM